MTRMDQRTREIAPGAKMPLISMRFEEPDNRVKPRVKEWLALGGRGIEVDGKRANIKKHVADAIKEFGKVDRKDLFFIATVPNCNHEKVAEKLEDDLRELDTEYVDLLMISRANGGNCSLAWAEMEKIYTTKQARAIGVKNFNKNHLKKLVANAEVIPHVGQVGLNFFDRSSPLTNYLAENKIEIQSHSPFGGSNETDLSRISENEIISGIAEGHGVSADQLAMKWILHHGWSLSFDAPLDVVKMKTYRKMSEFQLTATEMKKLNKLGEPGGQNHNGQHNGRPHGHNNNNTKLEIDTREIAAGVQMPVISADFDKIDHPNLSVMFKLKLKHWISIGGTGIYVSDHIEKFGLAFRMEEGENNTNIDRENLFFTLKVPNCNHTKVADKVKTDLRRIGTDYADLILLQHSRNGDCNLAWTEMEKLLDANETRAIGISEFAMKPLKQFLNNTKTKPHVYRGTFNIFDPHLNEMRFLNRKKIKVQSDSPFGDDRTLISENPLIKKIAAQRGVTPRQVAMKWVLQNKMLLSFGGNTINVTKQSLDMSAFTLNNVEMKELNQLHLNNGRSNKKGGTFAIISTIVLAFLLLGAGIIIGRKILYRRRKRRSLEVGTDGIFMTSRRSSTAVEYRDEPSPSGGKYRDEPAVAAEGVGNSSNDERNCDSSPDDEIIEMEQTTLSGDIC